MCVYACACVCVCVSVNVCITSVYARTHVCASVFVSTYEVSSNYTYTYTHTQTHTYKDTHMNTNTHTFISIHINNINNFILKLRILYLSDRAFVELRQYSLGTDSTALASSLFLANMIIRPRGPHVVRILCCMIHDGKGDLVCPSRLYTWLYSTDFVN